MRMVAPQGLFVDGQGSLLKRLRLLIPFLITIKLRKVIQVPSHIGMVLSQGPLIDLQCLLQKRFYFTVLFPREVKHSQIVETRRHMWVVGSQGFFQDRQRSLVEWLRLIVSFLGVIERR